MIFWRNLKGSHFFVLEWELPGPNERSTTPIIQWRLYADHVLAPLRRSRLSQSQFAELMGVSVRTLQEREQGRRDSSGAAKTLLRVV